MLPKVIVFDIWFSISPYRHSNIPGHLDQSLPTIAFVRTRIVLEGWWSIRVCPTANRSVVCWVRAIAPLVAAEPSGVVCERTKVLPLVDAHLLAPIGFVFF